MQKDLPQKLDDESLGQLTPEQLAKIIIGQARTIEKLNNRIVELEQEVEKLKVSRDLDSQTSSKPPSGDILKKTEKKQEKQPGESEARKRSPGGQPGHL
ncbi:MAG: IS66 family transposase, partial [Hydrococcus sp. RM1_1_31]|nr:IS66 family transposase [Hydrococcus sp. RM1_1_31]